MTAAAPTTNDILVSALRKLNALGAGTISPAAEDLELALNTFNEISEQLNLRSKNCFFARNQSFTWGTAKQEYTIGAASDSPDFVVAAGGRPLKIETAQIVDTGVSPNINIKCAILNFIQYQKVITIPALSEQFPQVITYQATVPNGTITPYPAFPTNVTWQLNLTWWNQLETVAMADVNTDLILAPGYRRGLATKLAVALWLSFAKRTDLEELKRQDREIWSDIQSLNAPPLPIPSTDGVGFGPGTFDYRSRQWQ